MSNQGQVRKFKKGELIFREGDKGGMAYLVQSGRVLVYTQRGPSRVEIMKLGKSAIIGANSALSAENAGYSYSAEALLSCELIELPLDMLRSQLAAANNVQRLVLKSMSEQLKQSNEELKSLRFEKEESPCPVLFLPRLFSILNLVTRRYGGEEGGEWSIAWSTLRTYTLRVFLESTGRMQSFLTLLTKLDLASLVTQENEEGEQELAYVRLKDLGFIEEFSDFFQRNLYKQGKSKLIEVDQLCFNVLKVLLYFARGRELDRHRAVRVPIREIIDKSRSELRINFKQEQLDLLKEKGLDIKRVSQDDEILLSFDPEEFGKIFRYWQVLREVEKWNKTGRVDLQDKEDVLEAEELAGACPQCGGEVSETMKFCPHCGFKLSS